MTTCHSETISRSYVDEDGSIRYYKVSCTDDIGRFIKLERYYDKKVTAKILLTVDEAEDLVDILHKYIMRMKNDRSRYTTDLYTADEQSLGELQEGC